MKVALVLLVAIVLFLLLLISRLRKINSDLFSALVEQVYLSDNLQQDKIKEDFLKFVSDSREWAFNYIEEVQQEVEIILADMSKIVEKIESKKKKTLEEKYLIDVFNKLKTLLPEQGN